MKNMVTVFTPTYNRGGCKNLGKCYSDLCNQTCKDFLWLIIDDGSTDNTKETVQRWISENKIQIKYVYKKNGGVHTGYNKAFDLCETELLFCFETDDELAPDAIEIILKETGKDFDKYIGLISSTHYIGSGKIIGKDLPCRLKAINYADCYYKYRRTGDKFFVYRKSCIGDYRFPRFRGEKLCGTTTLLLAMKGKYKIVRRPIYNKSYQEDGYTKKDHRMLYIESPHGFSYLHKVKLQEINNLDTIIKSSIHYIGCSLLGKEKHIIKNSPRKVWTIILFPVGFAWFIVLFREKKRMNKKRNI